MTQVKTLLFFANDLSVVLANSTGQGIQRTEESSSNVAKSHKEVRLKQATIRSPLFHATSRELAGTFSALCLPRITKSIP
jgi:hypothetical protein